MNPPFSVLNYLFSFEGRINRAKYWAFFGLSILLMLAFTAVAAVLGIALADPKDPSAAQIVGTILGLLQMILFLPYMVAAFAIGVKRWHDRGKSGWWILIGFIPLIGPIWTFIECGCLKGTQGDNRFGPDPLAPRLEAVFE